MRLRATAILATAAFGLAIPAPGLAEGAGQGMKSVTREVCAHVLRDEPTWLLDALARQARGGPVVASTSPMVSAEDQRPAHADLSV